MRDWFAWYRAQHQKEKRWSTYRDRFLCPCCFMPTLRERGGYDICPICFWEDDGQDTDDALEVRGGPNRDYSLDEARKNFQKHFTMYRPEDARSFGREQQTRTSRQALYEAYSTAIVSGTEEAWAQAMQIEKRYREKQS